MIQTFLLDPTITEDETIVKGIIRMKDITWLATYLNKEFGITTEDIQNSFRAFDDRVDKMVKSVKDNWPDVSRLWYFQDGDAVIGYASGYKHKE